MSYQIKEIIIFPKDHSFDKKVLTFFEGEMNVVYGVAQSGKSALLEIINYCLCSSSCGIPVGVTRDCVDYYGVRLVLDGMSIFVARKCPDGDKKESTLMYFDYGKNIKIPEHIESNSTCDDVKNQLNVIFGHSQRSLINEKEKNKNAHSTFRTGVSLMLQSKNCLTDGKQLFDISDYKGREYLVSLQVENSLGLLSVEDVDKRLKLQSLKERIEKISSKQAQQEENKATLASRAKNWINKSFEYGLIDSNNTEDKTTNELMHTLVSILNKKEELIQSTNKIIEATEKTVELENRVDELSISLSHNKQKLSQISKIVSQKETLNNSFKVQIERIEISKWLKELMKNGDPNFYGYDFSVNEINDLVECTEDIEKQIRDNNEYFISLEKEKAALEATIKKQSSELELIQNQLNSSCFQFNKKESGYTLNDKLIFLGQLDMFIKQNSSEEKDYSSEKDDLEKQADELNKLTISQKELYENNKKLFENLIRQHAFSFKAEYSDKDVVFSFNPLKLNVLVNNSYQPLSSLGSSSNMLYYHTAVELAILEFKRNVTKDNLIPAFVILDQPSQCFFPSESEYEDGTLTDEDRETLKQYYKLLTDFVKKHGSQIIILEHADQTIWGSTAKVVDHFTDNNKLIPNSWIEKMADCDKKVVE